MRLTELRVLSGPSAEIPGPAVRLTFGGPTGPGAAALDPREVVSLVAEVARRAGVAGAGGYGRTGADGSVIVAFPWQRRGTGEALGEAVARIVTDGSGADREGLVARAAAEVAAADPGDPPDLLDPVIPTIAVTGTNGKTTTTRLLGAMAASAGRAAAWSSTDGVYVAGRCIESGDWSGPGGARLVLGQQGVELAILETARGGLMQRGMGVSCVDVAVFTNVSADHLGLQGIDTVADLAWAKSTTVRVVRPTGWAVLNAADPLVRTHHADCPGRTWFFCLDPDGEAAGYAARHGQRLTTVRNGSVVVRSRAGDPSAARVPAPAGYPADADAPELPGVPPVGASGADPQGVVETVVAAVVDIPVTLAGLSRENIENALAATSAALAIGLPLQAVRDGLARFVPDTTASPGRMNIWSVATADGGAATVILDFAHNEAGAEALFRVGVGLRRPGARLHVSIGNAGDRTDQGIAAVGRMAAEVADTIQLAAKPRYLRGRTQQELDDLQVAGIRSAGREPMDIVADEVSGLRALVGRCADGDVVAMMVHQERDACVELLERLGARADRPADIARKARVAAGSTG